MKIRSTVCSRGGTAFVPPPLQVPKSASSRERGGADAEHCPLMKGSLTSCPSCSVRHRRGGICPMDPGTMQRAPETLTGMCGTTPGLTAGAEKGR